MIKNKIIPPALLALLLAVVFLFGSAKVFAADVVIDLSAERQVIRGFGGMNHPLWIGDLTAAQRETAFGNGANQLGFSVLRVFVNENSNDWQRDLPTAKWASDRGVLVFASPWNPPSSMRTTGQSRYNSGSEFSNTRLIRTDMFSQYVDHLNAFVKYMEDNGVNLHAISVQNEHDYGYHGEWTEWTAAEIRTFMRDHAGNINSRVISPEPFQYRKDELNAILNDPVALANTDIIATHIYGTRPEDLRYPLFKEKGAGKELWMTEVYHPNSSDSANLWPQALEVATHVHRAMVDGEFQMYVWWYIRRYYSPIMEDGSISKRGWMMAHFSKFVRPGYVRVDATPPVPVSETRSPNSWNHGTGGAFVSAYKGGDTALVIVAVNREASVSNLNLTINGGAARTVTVERYRTTGTDNMARLQDVEVNGSGFDVSLPAQSVTTYIVRYNATTSVISGVTSAMRNVTPLITVRGRMLNVSSSDNSELRIRVVNLTGRTVASFNTTGGSTLSLKKIPAGMYVIEAKRMSDGMRTMSNVVLR
jgi:glucuronoarabinoxylan endo-1,4-beta-xylanase